MCEEFSEIVVEWCREELSKFLVRETVVERAERSGGKGIKRKLVTQRERPLERREVTWWWCTRWETGYFAGAAKSSEARMATASSSERTKNGNVGRRDGGEQGKKSNGHTGAAAVRTAEKVRPAAAPLLASKRSPESICTARRKKCC